MKTVNPELRGGNVFMDWQLPIQSSKTAYQSDFKFNDMESEILLGEQQSGSHSDSLQTKQPKDLEILNIVNIKRSHN